MPRLQTLIFEKFYLVGVEVSQRVICGHVDVLVMKDVMPLWESASFNILPWIVLYYLSVIFSLRIIIGKQGCSYQRVSHECLPLKEIQMQLLQPEPSPLYGHLSCPFWQKIRILAIKIQFLRIHLNKPLKYLALWILFRPLWMVKSCALGGPEENRFPM